MKKNEHEGNSLIILIFRSSLCDVALLYYSVTSLYLYGYITGVFSSFASPSLPHILLFFSFSSQGKKEKRKKEKESKEKEKKDKGKSKRSKSPTQEPHRGQRRGTEVLAHTHTRNLNGNLNTETHITF